MTAEQVVKDNPLV